jgi:hypothetical protein
MSGTAVRYGRPVGLVAAAALALSTVSTTGAQAAPAAPSQCTVESYTPTSVVVGSSAVSATFAVHATGCTVAVWAIGFEALDAVPTSIKKKVSISPTVLTNADAGAKGAAVLALGTEDAEDADPAELDTTFSLLRRSTWGTTFNATPEPVVKGARITVKGTLTRVSWNGKKKSTYGPYGSRLVDIQFQAPGTTTWVTIKSVTTGKTGKLNSTVKAITTGTWRLHFKGNSVSGAANSKTDKVVVS